jgi:hypothetical protein
VVPKRPSHRSPDNGLPYFTTYNIIYLIHASYKIRVLTYGFSKLKIIGM